MDGEAGGGELRCIGKATNTLAAGSTVLSPSLCNIFNGSNRTYGYFLILLPNPDIVGAQNPSMYVSLCLFQSRT